MKRLGWWILALAVLPLSACTTMRPLRSYTGQQPPEDLTRYAESASQPAPAGGFVPVPEYVALPGPGDEQAREALMRLIQEIDATLLPLVAEAQRHGDPTSRIRFRYDWLAADLEAIRAALAQYLANPGADDPVGAVVPLRGHYRQ